MQDQELRGPGTSSNTSSTGSRRRFASGSTAAARSRNGFGVVPRLNREGGSWTGSTARRIDPRPLPGELDELVLDRHGPVRATRLAGVLVSFSMPEEDRPQQLVSPRRCADCAGAVSRLVARACSMTRAGLSRPGRRAPGRARRARVDVGEGAQCSSSNSVSMATSGAVPGAAPPPPPHRVGGELGGGYRARRRASRSPRARRAASNRGRPIASIAASPEQAYRPASNRLHSRLGHARFSTGWRTGCPL